ncbi:MAG: carbon-nitrogen hydrolase family protein [bacterium]|nr:carbon-nitrogen hydrolase family protein [bacterium]
MNEKIVPFTDLLLDPNTWEAWTPRDEVEIRSSVLIDGGPGGRPALVLEGAGNPFACGCWRLSLGGLQGGRRYRVEVVFRTEGVDAPGKCVRAILTEQPEQKKEPAFYDHLDSMGRRDGWQVLARELDVAGETPALALNLFLAWSARGHVRWSDVRLYDVTAERAGGRNVKLAAISGNPKNPTSPAACIDFYANRIDEVRGADLVCLPELINVMGVPQDRAGLAEPIPGPTSERLSDRARTHGFYLAASILERAGGAIYNTGLLIDRSGGIVGKYRKTHLAPGEDLLQGVAPGNDYPVFRTDFGTVGYMICWDGHFPEVPRLLSLNGAEVILFSNAGDGREGGSLWEPFIRTRALDNQVHIVAAVNAGRSCIVSPKGEVLSMADQTSGAIASATCDLDASVANFSGRPIHRRYDQYRRADSYDALRRHLWDI